MSDRGCPQCGYSKHVGLEIDSQAKLKISPWYLHPDKIKFEPKICMNCGTVYIDTSTLVKIKALIKSNCNKD